MIKDSVQLTTMELFSLHGGKNRALGLIFGNQFAVSLFIDIPFMPDAKNDNKNSDYDGCGYQDQNKGSVIFSNFFIP